MLAGHVLTCWNPFRTRSFGAVAGVAIATCLLAGLAFGIAQRNKPDTGAEISLQIPLDVPVVRAKNRPVIQVIESIGNLRAAQGVVLTPDSPGRVVALYFESGDVVKKGTVLVQLDDALEQADYAAARARAAFAKQQYTRAESLQETHAISIETLDLRRSQYDQARAETRQRAARLEQKKIRAPFSGQLGIRRINMGQYLQPGDRVASLTHLDNLYVDFAVPQEDMPKLARGTPIRLAIDSLPHQQLVGEVASIDPQVDSDTRNAEVEARLENPHHILKPGMYAEVRVEIRGEGEAITLPLTAILTSSYGNTVLMVESLDAKGVGKAIRVPVDVGRRMGDVAVITDGLRAGDVVITAGQGRVHAGARVRVRPAELTELIAAGQ